MTGLPLTENWYDVGRTLAENREYCRLLKIRNDADLQRIMMAAVPWLILRMQQLDTGIPRLLQGGLVDLRPVYRSGRARAGGAAALPPLSVLVCG